MTPTLMLLSTCLAFPPDLGIPQDPRQSARDYRVLTLATSQTGRTIITGTRVDVMVVEGFRTGQYTRKFVVEDVRVSGIQPDAPLFGQPTKMVTIKVSERQLAELELASEKGKLILTLHPLVKPRLEDKKSNTSSKGLLQRGY